MNENELTKKIHLKNCESCGADPKESCEVLVFRNPFSKNRITKTSFICLECGYSITVENPKNPIITRKLWNTRLGDSI